MQYYVGFTALGIIVASIVAYLLDMPKPSEKKSMEIFISAAIGLLIGAKLPVWISYGFNQEFIFFGKSVMGGILGAFIGINIYKYFSKQTDASFGGRFVIPLAIAIGFGKIGCYMNGCCGGHFIIPTQLIESAFQFFIAILLYIFYKRTNRIDLLFPVYLLAYLTFRFFIEFVRNEPRIFVNLTIYQLLALIFIPIIFSILIKRKGHHNV